MKKSESVKQGQSGPCDAPGTRSREGVRDLRIDGRTDGWTDGPSNRFASAHLKSQNSLSPSSLFLFLVKQWFIVIICICIRLLNPKIIFFRKYSNVTGEQSIAKQSFADQQIDIATSGSFLEFVAAIFFAGKPINKAECLSRAQSRLTNSMTR